MNNCTLIGRLTKDPVLRYTQGGKAVATFTLAVDRETTDSNGKRPADFLNIVVWEKTAENCAQYLKKGQRAGVEGRIEIREYEVEGQKRWATEIKARRVEFLEPKSQSQTPSPSGNTPAFDSLSLDDDIPF